MQRNITLTFLALFLLTFAFESEAQKRRRYGMRNKSKKYSKYSTGRVGYSGVGTVKYSTISLSINTNNYYGDIAPAPSKLSTDYKFVPNGIGIAYSKVLAPGIFGRVGFNYGRVTGDDYSTATASGDESQRGRYARNFHFRNDIMELSAVFELDLLPSNSGARGRFPINPYAFFGAAGFYHSPKAIAPEFDQAGNPVAEAGSWVDLQSLGTEGQNLDTLGTSPYSKFQFAIPAGFGVKVKLTGNLDLNVEFGLRFLFTDYLDDISGEYIDLAAFDGDDYALVRAMSERGAESSALFTGSERNPDFYNTSNSGRDPISGRPFTVGENYNPGVGTRGNPDNNDVYTTTAIRLVYILDRPGQVRGKYR